MSIGFWQVVVIALVVVAIFSAGRINRFFRELGKGVKSFKEEIDSVKPETSKVVSLESVRASQSKPVASKKTPAKKAPQKTAAAAKKTVKAATKAKPAAAKKAAKPVAAKAKPAAKKVVKKAAVKSAAKATTKKPVKKK